MSESHDMTPDDTAAMPLMDKTLDDSSGKLLLDRPLHQITEDDIAQLTREDCRRYLKEKGMRRPSWNKSQAIQQVIMLKKLLESESEADPRKLPNHIDHISNYDAVKAREDKRRDAEFPVFTTETPPHHIGDLNKPDPLEGFSGGSAAAKNESTQPRTIGTTNIAATQMTILYGGKVNVYDDMPADKARAILHLAAIPVEFPEQQQLNDSKILEPLSELSKAFNMKVCQNSSDVILPGLHIANMRGNSLMFGEENIVLLEGTPVEGPSGRKASIQRYLEKKKDRWSFKSKRSGGSTPCTSLDMYFNHQACNEIPTIDPHFQIRTRQLSTPTPCSLENDSHSVQNVCISTGLSNKGLPVDLT